MRRRSDRGATNLTGHPLGWVIIALALGAIAGVAIYASTRSPKSPTSSTHSQALPPVGSHLSFDATFAGASLDTRVWASCYWYVPAGAGCGHFGVYPELQWYLPSQDQVFGAALHLLASPTRTTGTNEQGQSETYQCTSGVVTTSPSFNFTYGYVQIVARLPRDPNAWPALWMLPSSHKADLPEIDIMEMLGKHTDRPLMTFHPASGPQRQLIVTTADLSSGWHTFGLDWEPGSLKWYIDGKFDFAVTSKVPDQPMYILADLAITDVVEPLQLPGGCSASLVIRSVKVWQKAAG